ncbi:hypothetical protein ACHQM5_016962 [Ranunculus cassubicifolius]
MRILYWNIRGIRKEVALNRLKELVRDYNFDIVGISEPKVKPRSDSVIRMGLDQYDCQVIHNGDGKFLPNLWVLAKKGLNLSLVKAIKQQITISFDQVMVSFVHASSQYNFRRQLWSTLESLQVAGPWLIAGDFNCVMNADEKKGGRSPLRIAVEEFYNWSSRCQLLEPPHSGMKCTWCNNRKGSARIVAHLDRMFVNYHWSTKFLGWSYKILQRHASDHSPMCSSYLAVPKPNNCHFRFNRMWVLADGSR